MTQAFTLTSDQRDAFAQHGVLRLPALIDPHTVQAARQVVLRQLERAGLWKDGAWQMDAAPRPKWPDHVVKTSKVIGNRFGELAALIEDPALVAAVDTLLEGRPYLKTGPNLRPQVLFTLPNIDVWGRPSGWHSDSPRLASGESLGVQLFTFLDTVEPQGGGTLAIAGSHRLMHEGRHMRPSDFPRRLKAEPFFAGLLQPYPELGGPDLPSGEAAGIPQQVVELTGEPGDAWLIDLGTLHTGAPNAAAHPRLMVTYRYMRADLRKELAEAWGWPTPA